MDLIRCLVWEFQSALHDKCICQKVESLKLNIMFLRLLVLGRVLYPLGFLGFLIFISFLTGVFIVFSGGYRVHAHQK